MDMDDYDIDRLAEEIAARWEEQVAEEEEAHALGVPRTVLRAVYRHRLLSVRQYEPWPFDDTDYASAQRALTKDSEIADLAVSGAPDAEELTVTFLARSGEPARARSALIEWANLVGFSRVWLPGEVITTTSRPSDHDRAVAQCRVCGTTVTGSGEYFWNAVRARRNFPEDCGLCLGPLLGWRVPERQSYGAQSHPRRPKSPDGRPAHR